MIARFVAHPLAQNIALVARRDPYLLLSAAHTQGDVVRLRVGRRELLIFNSPQAALEILAIHHANFVKGRAHARSRSWLGDGLLVSEGALHHEIRRQLQSAFQVANVMAHAPMMVEHAAECGASWRAGEVRDVWQEMLHLALAIIVHAVSGHAMHDEIPGLSAALTVLADWLHRQSSPFARIANRLLLSQRRERMRSQQLLDQAIIRMIESSIQRGANDHSVVAQLLRAGTPLALIRDQVLTLLLAGRETVAAALTWTWYELARRPDLAATFHAEIDTVLAGRLPTVEDIPRLRFTRMLFTETLRHYPPSWSTSRRALNACPIRGTTVPRDAAVIVSQYVLHHDPRFFSDPMTFAPQRWEQAALTDMPKGAFIPFGIGPRRCIGETFAWTESILVLATLARMWHMVPASAAPALHPSTSLQPRGGLAMRLIPR